MTVTVSIYNYIIPRLLKLKITCKLREHEREDKNKVPDLPPTDKTRTVLIFVLSNDLLVNTSWHGVMWQISPHQAIDVVQDIKQVILLWTEILQSNEHRIVKNSYDSFSTVLFFHVHLDVKDAYSFNKILSVKALLRGNCGATSVWKQSTSKMIMMVLILMLE